MEAPVGQLGLSESLRSFVNEHRWERASIATFVRDAARSLPPGSRVADVGAGEAPYRELFAGHDYVTIDWAETVHDLPEGPGIVADAAAIPVDDGAFDAVVLTQVLEHVPEPLAVLRELQRILVAGGQLFLTAPFAWEEHEIPHDYARYTRYGLRHLAERAGFVDIEVTARNDCFTTLAQLVRNAAWTMGRAEDGLDGERHAAQELLEQLADQLARLAPLDSQWIFPLGYAMSARKPVVT
jgi:SAM-dependent methyltransferase